MSSTTIDAATRSLANLVSVLAEDAMFAIAAAANDSEMGEALEGIAKRRSEAYVAVLQGTPLYRMTEAFDYWIVEMTRAMAPVAPPSWMPMSEVLREKVTLEIGARGLRSLFSSKPSDKEVHRVKRLGTLAVRALRATFAADGLLRPEEERTLAAFIGSLGLPPEEAAPLYKETPIAVATLDIYGDIEPAVASALIRGAWMAAAWDAIDPREEEVVRALGKKLGVVDDEVEKSRAQAVERVDARKEMGLAAVDAVRFVLSDRVPGLGVTLAACVASLVLPERYREEAHAAVAHGQKVPLAKRHSRLSSEARATVLGLAWCAALHEDPSLARRAMIRARYDRVAADLGDDGDKTRTTIDAWMDGVVAPAAVKLG